ncbi:MAG: alanine/ornithine racemase family PLP-dependent enzyme, partial [Thermoplasmata archaeon]
ALGRDTTNDRKIDYLRQDTFIVEGEIIEIDEKPTIPDGEIGRDAFGKIPKFENIGLIKRAILAMGKHDVEFDALIPLEDVKILGGSGDHMILDIRNIKRDIKVGDRLAFYPLYPSLLQLMESRYVKKVFHY